MKLSHLNLWLIAVVAVSASYFVGMALRWIMFHYLRKWSEKTDTFVDDVIIEYGGSYILYFSVLFAAYAAVFILPVTSGQQLLTQKIIVGIGMAAVTLMISSMVYGMIDGYMKQQSLEMPQSSLTQNIIRVVIIAIGGLLILSHFGVAITPLLTALGVGSLAVALALQDTLSNAFAGFHIIVSKQIRIGDYVKMDSGQEGTIIDIGWRNTHVKQLSNNVVIVPNSKITTSVVVNCSMPDRQVAFTVPVGVAYGSDLEKVEDVAVEVAEDILKTIPGGVTDFKPLVRFTSFADSAITFNVVLRGSAFTDQGLITHEFIKKLNARFTREGIEIPFPQRVVHLKK